METLSVILLAMAALFAIYWTFRIKKVIPMIINIGMVIGIIMVLIPVLNLLEAGIYTYIGFAVLGFYHGLADRNRKLIDRLIICLMTATISLYWLWLLNHWHGNTLLAAAFVLLVGLAGILTKTKLREELGFLVIIAVDAISILITA
jgi:hypothetical protein